MKTKTLFLLCFLMGIGLTRISAQTKSIPGRVSLNGVYELPVFCNGVEGEVDRVALGDFIWHGQTHYVKGVAVWGTGKLMGECYSKLSGEVFTYKETDPRQLYSGTTYTVIYNLIGDQGHHYLGTFTVEFWDAVLVLNPVVIRTECVYNGPDKD